MQGILAFSKMLQSSSLPPVLSFSKRWGFLWENALRPRHVNIGKTHSCYKGTTVDPVPPASLATHARPAAPTGR